MATTRIYLVTNKSTGARALVDCAHPSTAVRYVASSAFDVEVASTRQVASLMGSGAKVETPGGEQLELPEVTS